MNRARLVIVFGSRARNTAGRNSDLDVAVLADHPLSLEEKSDLTAEITRKLNVAEDRIDLVDLWHASPLLLRRVADEGKLLRGNEFEFLRFRVLAWKKYQDTAKLRRLREKTLADQYAK